MTLFTFFEASACICCWLGRSMMIGSLGRSYEACLGLTVGAGSYFGLATTLSPVFTRAGSGVAMTI